MNHHLLTIETSASGPQSSTRRIAKLFLDAWRDAHPSAKLTTRDVAKNKVPHVDADYLANMQSEPGPLASRTRKESIARTKQFQSEVLAASHILIATPMHIFSVPSSLKAWIDHIFHEGVVFDVEGDDLTGLLTGKKVAIITSRGGDYRAPSPLAEFDMLTPYFEKLFAFCGVTDFQSFDVHNGMFDPDDHQSQVSTMLEHVEKFAREWD